MSPDFQMCNATFADRFIRINCLYWKYYHIRNIKTILTSVFISITFSLHAVVDLVRPRVDTDVEILPSSSKWRWIGGGRRWITKKEDGGQRWRMKKGDGAKQWRTNKRGDEGRRWRTELGVWVKFFWESLWDFCILEEGMWAYLFYFKFSFQNKIAN